MNNNNIPDDWKEKYNSPEYDDAFTRLIVDVAVTELAERERKRNTALGCIVVLVFAVLVAVLVAIVVFG